jgi:hypothetical protein
MDGRSPPPRRPEGSLGKDVQASLGTILRDHYQKIVKEGVPDRFASLMQRYEQKVQGTPTQHLTEVPDVAKGDDSEGKDPAA